MRIIDDKPWFMPKPYGFGAGLPIAWQGWVVLALFIAGMAASGAWLHGAWRVTGMAVCLVLLLVICAAKTEGGWRWGARP